MFKLGELFKRDERGNVAVIVALCLPMVLGGAAYGIETGYWRYDQVRVQQAADTAAYAAAVVKRSNSTATQSALTDVATTAAASNGYSNSTDTITLTIPSAATPSDPNSVEATISRTEPQIFVAYIHCLVSSGGGNCAGNNTIVNASSTASFSNAGDACILALSPSANKAADFAGNSNLTLNGCTVMSNSLAADSVNVQGSSVLTAPCVYSAGGAYQGGSINLTTCGAVKTSQPPVADPYAALAMPTAGMPKNFNANNAKCGDTFSSMSIKTSVTLPSCGSGQVYTISGGALDINANGALNCGGCTFYLTNGATVTMNGNAGINASAPTSGTYSGMLFISDRNNTGSITINGNSASSVTGAIYAPHGQVNYIGNYSGSNGCTQIVALTVAWSGDTSFADNCSAAGMAPVKVGSVVRLSA